MLVRIVEQNAIAQLPVATPSDFYDVNDGGELSDELVRDYVKQFPTVLAPWDSLKRQKELRPFLYPCNYHEEWQGREAGKLPEISAGRWAPVLKERPQGPSVIKADKIAQNTQKSIEDCFRVYWDMLFVPWKKRRQLDEHLSKLSLML